MGLWRPGYDGARTGLRIRVPAGMDECPFRSFSMQPCVAKQRNGRLGAWGGKSMAPMIWQRHVPYAFRRHWTCNRWWPYKLGGSSDSRRVETAVQQTVGKQQIGQQSVQGATGRTFAWSRGPGAVTVRTTDFSRATVAGIFLRAGPRTFWPQIVRIDIAEATKSLAGGRLDMVRAPIFWPRPAGKRVRRRDGRSSKGRRRQSAGRRAVPGVPGWATGAPREGSRARAEPVVGGWWGREQPPGGKPRTFAQGLQGSENDRPSDTKNLAVFVGRAPRTATFANGRRARTTEIPGTI